MANNLFREKTLKRISSPEEMDHYIRVINPSVWVVLSAIVILLIGFVVWGIFGRVETKIKVSGLVENGHMVTELVVTDPNVDKIKKDKLVLMDKTEVGKVSAFRLNSDGKLLVDINTVNLADGKYDLDILIESINLMYFIFN